MTGDLLKLLGVQVFSSLPEKDISYLPELSSDSFHARLSVYSVRTESWTLTVMFQGPIFNIQGLVSQFLFLFPLGEPGISLY